MYVDAMLARIKAPIQLLGYITGRRVELQLLNLQRRMPPDHLHWFDASGKLIAAAH